MRSEHHSFTFIVTRATLRPQIHHLSLHDALPIWPARDAGRNPPAARRNPVRAAAQPAGSARAGCAGTDRKSTCLNSSHVATSYAVFCLETQKLLEWAARSILTVANKLPMTLVTQR